MDNQQGSWNGFPVCNDGWGSSSDRSETFLCQYSMPMRWGTPRDDRMSLVCVCVCVCVALFRVEPISVGSLSSHCQSFKTEDGRRYYLQLRAVVHLWSLSTIKLPGCQDFCLFINSFLFHIIRIMVMEKGTPSCPFLVSFFITRRPVLDKRNNHLFEVVFF